MEIVLGLFRLNDSKLTLSYRIAPNCSPIEVKIKFIDKLERTFMNELFNSYISDIIFYTELFVAEGQRLRQKFANPRGILGTDVNGLNMFRFAFTETFFFCFSVHP